MYIFLWYAGQIRQSEMNLSAVGVGSKIGASQLQLNGHNY